MPDTAMGVLYGMAAVVAVSMAAWMGGVVALNSCVELGVARTELHKVIVCAERK